MYEDFLKDRCDIYHLQSKTETVGYGFNDTPGDTIFSYPDTPDIEGVKCHFHRKSKSVNLIQDEPQNKLVITRKLGLPMGTDIRTNDKVVDCATGIGYTAQLPDNIQTHHMTVTLIRTEEQKPL